MAGFSGPSGGGSEIRMKFYLTLLVLLVSSCSGSRSQRDTADGGQQSDEQSLTDVVTDTRPSQQRADCPFVLAEHSPEFDDQCAAVSQEECVPLNRPVCEPGDTQMHCDCTYCGYGQCIQTRCDDCGLANPDAS
jgi:hypothetical protein